MYLVLGYFALAAVALVVLLIVDKRTKLEMMKATDYAWYKRTYPDLVGQGRVTCHGCGESKIGTERLLNRTFTRAHVCRTCGTTLYYSPE